MLYLVKAIYGGSTMFVAIVSLKKQRLYNVKRMHERIERTESEKG